jgi:hypothetical protein
MEPMGNSVNARFYASIMMFELPLWLQFSHIYETPGFERWFQVRIGHQSQTSLHVPALAASTAASTSASPALWILSETRLSSLGLLQASSVGA